MYMNRKVLSESIHMQLFSRNQHLKIPDFPCIRLFYVHSGSLHIRLAQETLSLTWGEILLFQETDFEVVHLDKETEVLALFIGLDYFQQHTFNTIWREAFFSEFILWIFDSRLRSFSHALYHATPENNLAGLLTALYEELSSSALCAENASDCYVLLAFIQLAREYSREYGDVTRNKHLEYGRLIHYLNDNYRTATLDETAAYFHFSPAYISKFLKKTTGKSFIEYIQQQRVAAAEQVLKNSEMPVNSIAKQIGYQNVSYFYRIFEKYNGCTPLEYRRRARTGHEGNLTHS